MTKIISYQDLNPAMHFPEVIENKQVKTGQWVQIRTCSDRMGTFQRVIHIVKAIALVAFTLTLALVFQWGRDICKEAFNFKAKKFYIDFKTLPANEVSKVVKANGLMLEHASEAVKAERGVVKDAVEQNVLAFELASEELKKDLDFVLELINKKGTAVLIHASNTVKGNKDFIASLAKKNIEILEYASIALKKDKSFLAQFEIEECSRFFEYVDEELKNNFDYVLHLVGKRGEWLAYASQRLKDDNKIVYAAVNQNGLSIKFASERCRRDPDLALAAIKNDITAFSSLGQELRYDKKFIIQAVKINSTIFDMQINPLFREDKEVILASLEGIFPYEEGGIRYASPELLNDPVFMLDALKKNPKIVNWIPKKLINREFVIEAAEIQNKIFEHAELKDNKALIKSILKSRANSRLFQYIAKELQNDKSFVLELLNTNKDVYRYIHGPLHLDPDIDAAAINW